MTGVAATATAATFATQDTAVDAAQFATSKTVTVELPGELVKAFGDAWADSWLQDPGKKEKPEDSEKHIGFALAIALAALVTVATTPVGEKKRFVENITKGFRNQKIASNTVGAVKYTQIGLKNVKFYEP